jgi:putative copper resistance protein D
LIGLALACADPPSIAIAREVVLRFSTLGIVSVGTLLTTGIINTWAILGSLTAFPAPITADCCSSRSRCFLRCCHSPLSIAFGTPVFQRNLNAIGAINALHRIRANTLLEAAFGIIIVAVVGLLGTLSPGE